MKRGLLIFTQLLFVLGTYAQTQQELRDSVSRMSAQLEVRPQNIELRMRKAALNIELGQWQYALDEYTKVLELNPEYLTALYYRAFVNQHLGRYAFARADYEKVLAQEPANLQSHIGLVLANLADGRTTEAYDGVNRMVEAFPASARVYDVRAEVEQALRMMPAAEEDVEKAMAIEEESLKNVTSLVDDDDMVSYKLHACNIYLAAGKKSEAKACLDYLNARGVSKALLAGYYSSLTR